MSGSTEAPSLQFRVGNFNIPDNNVREGEAVKVEADVTNLNSGIAVYEAILCWIPRFIQPVQLNLIQVRRFQYLFRLHQSRESIRSVLIGI